MIGRLFSTQGVSQHRAVSSRGWILVVDDHVAMAENIAEMLEMDGYRASVAESAEEALTLFTEKISALVTDFRMSAGSGAELIAEIRRRGSWIPAVVVTAYSDEATYDACTKAGALAVLPKPLEMGSTARGGFERRPVPEFVTWYERCFSPDHASRDRASPERAFEVDLRAEASRIAVLSEHEFCRDGIVEILRGHGFRRVEGFASSGTLLKRARVTPLDLAIVDLAHERENSEEARGAGCGQRRRI